MKECSLLEVAYMFNEHLHILQGQFLETQLVIRTLNSSRVLEFFISVGTLSHSIGPIEDAASMSYLSVHGMPQLHLD